MNVLCGHKTTECSWCAVHECGMDTHNHLPFRALPSQCAKRQHCTTWIQRCLCAKHKANTWTTEVRRQLEVWTWKILLWNKLGLEVQEDKSGLCSVGVFTSCSGVHLWWIIRGTPAVLEPIVELYFPLHQQSHWDDEKDGCACCSSCSKFPPAILCSCSRYFTIFTVKWNSGCWFTGIEFPSLSCIFCLREWICSRNWRGWWYSAWSPSPSHLSVSALQFFYCMSVSELLLSVFFVYFPAIHATFEIDVCFLIGSTTPLLVYLPKWSRISVQCRPLIIDVLWRSPRQTCSAIRSYTSDWMTREPCSIVT